MKNKIIIILIIILVFGFLLLVLLKNNKKETNNYRNELNNDEKEILVEKTYSNYAWSITVNKKVIFNDGTIYYFSLSGNMNEMSNYNINDAKSLVLEHGSKLDYKASEQDLKIIESEIKKVKEIENKECRGADQGSHTIAVYKDNEEIIIDESGDCEGHNDEYNKLISTINKYLK